LVAGAAFCWGTSATLARYLFRDRDVPVFTAVELRLVISVVLLGAWLAIRRPGALRVARADWGYFLILGVFGLATVQSTYYYAISVLGVGLGILLQYLAPTLIVAYEWLRGSRPEPKTLAALALALGGTVLLVGAFHPLAAKASAFDWMIGGSTALCFAFFIVFSKRGLERYPPETVLIHSSWIAGLFWAFIQPPWKIVAAGYDASTWVLFVVLAVTSTLIPFSLFYAGLHRMAPSRAGIIATLEPVVAVVSSSLFLAEGLTPRQTVGAGMVLSAAVLARARRPLNLRRPGGN